MTTTVPQSARLIGEAFSGWRFAKLFFTVVMVAYVLVPLKYLPEFLAENLEEKAVAAAMVVAAVVLAGFGVFSSVVNILMADFLLLISLKIVGVDITFRDVGPVLRRGFFVFGCGLMCLSGYLLLGDDWSIYQTAFPNVVMVIVVVAHIVELYRSLSVWGVPGRGRRIAAVSLYCVVPLILVGLLVVLGFFVS